MAGLETTATGVVWRSPDETLQVDAWGPGTFRVRASPSPPFAPADDALVRTEPTRATTAVEAGRVRVVNGDLTAVVEQHGRVWFTRTGEEQTLVGEPWYDPREPPTVPHRSFRAGPDGAWRVEATLEAFDGERLHGLGQHSTTRLDLKGTVVDLFQHNSQVGIPVLMSSRGYGFFWNSPSLGRVELARNHTRWVAEEAPQLDYFVYAGGTPAQVARRYADLTGYPPPMPRWATGYWQSNSYYRTQDELMAMAREHLARGLPLAAMFVDYMHWTHLGDFEWDREAWPDPDAMVRELAEHGVHLMVAVWPHVSPLSRHHDRLRDAGLLVADGRGGLARFAFADRAVPEGVDLALLDLTHPEARSFLWQRIAETYHRSGIHAFWLDASEPELTGRVHEPREASARYARGNGVACSSLFPLYDARAVREGLDSVGDTDAVLLARSAWAGSQRYGVAVWSGDIPSTWEALQGQVGAGLGMAASGIPWWTSDIGGFFLGDIHDEGFRELVVRWFQFAVLWPVLRLHGNRRPDFYEAGIFSAGEENQVWSFGERAYDAIRGLLAFRERLRPYLDAQLDTAAETGEPPVRPLWFAFPDDPEAVACDDQLVLGPDLLAAPVTGAGIETREVYLPRGARWRDVWTGEAHEGGVRVRVPCPLEVLPLFVRVGGAVEVTAEWFAHTPPEAGPDD